LRQGTFMTATEPRSPSMPASPPDPCKVGDPGWVSHGRSRAQARWYTATRHPMAIAAGLLRRRKGMSMRHQVPSSANDILERLAPLPISTWTYGFDDDTVRHLGPMAQDFARAFGLGDDVTTINLVDANGVTMAAIQALYRRVVALEEELARLRNRTVP